MELNYIDQYELVNGYAVIDTDFSIITANEPMYRFVGISSRFTIAEIIHQVDLDDFIEVANNLRMGQNKSMVVRMKRIDNSYRWVLADIKRCSLENKNQEEDTSMDYIELRVSDVLALKNHCNQLENYLSAYRRVIAKDDELFYIYEYDKDVFTVYSYIDSDSFVLISAPIKEVYERILAKNLIADSQLKAFEQLLTDIIKGKASYNYEFLVNVTKQEEGSSQVKVFESYLKGSTIYYQMKPVRSVGTLKLLGAESVFSKTTYDFEYHTHILEVSDLEKYAINNANYNKHCKLSFIRIVIDNFSQYKEKKGSVAADKLLDIIKDTLIKVIEYRGVVGRIDNDGQFVVIIKDVNNEPELRAFIEYMRSRIAWECRCYDNTYNISFSIGISRYPNNGTDWKLLADKLKKATQIALDKGGNRYIIYKEEIHGELE